MRSEVAAEHTACCWCLSVSVCVCVYCVYLQWRLETPVQSLGSCPGPPTHNGGILSSVTGSLGWIHCKTHLESSRRDVFAYICYPRNTFVSPLLSVRLCFFILKHKPKRHRCDFGWAFSYFLPFSEQRTEEPGLFPVVFSSSACAQVEVDRIADQSKAA